MSLSMYFGFQKQKEKTSNECYLFCLLRKSNYFSSKETDKKIIYKFN